MSPHRELCQHQLPQQCGDAVEDAHVDAVRDHQQDEAVVPEKPQHTGAVALRLSVLQRCLTRRGGQLRLVLKH